MVTSQCLRCTARFTDEQPRAFCPDCRPRAAAEMDATLDQYLLARPDMPMPGGRVRRKTDQDRAFERDVLADLDLLP